MKYEILNNEGKVINIILADDEDFVKSNFDFYRLAEKGSVDTIVVPQILTPIQFRLQLNKSGLRQTVETKVLESNDFDLKDWFEYSTEYKRDNEILISFAKQLEVTDEYLDNFFIEASKV